MLHTFPQAGRPFQDSDWLRPAVSLLRKQNLLNKSNEDWDHNTCYCTYPSHSPQSTQLGRYHLHIKIDDGNIKIHKYTGKQQVEYNQLPAPTTSPIFVCRSWNLDSSRRVIGRCMPSQSVLQPTNSGFVFPVVFYVRSSFEKNSSKLRNFSDLKRSIQEQPY